jgi:hypothetical protein
MLSLGAFVMSGVIACAGFGSAITEFQSNAAVDDLITYSFHEDNSQTATLCSAGNTQNVNEVGAETGASGGLTAIKIDQGGDCTFFMNLQQERGTYHLQIRLRVEASATDHSKAGTVTIRILANFRTADSLWYGIVMADGTQITGIPTTAGTNGAEKPWATLDVSNALSNVVRDWSNDGMESKVNFKNNGAQRIYLDAVYLATAQ